jgi:hypothetical protein
MGGMAKNLTNSDVPGEIHRFVQDLLDEGGSSAEISYYLALIGMDLGLSTAPDPHSAIAMVMEGIRDASALHSKAAKEQEAAEGPEILVQAPPTVH